jgi:hypothetical protein
MISDPHLGMIPKPMIENGEKIIVVGGDYMPRTGSWITRLIHYLWFKAFASKTGW